MIPGSLKTIGLFAKIAAGIGVLLFMIGRIIIAMRGDGTLVTAISYLFIGLALLMMIAWLMTDAITESIERVREAIVARWIDDPADNETPGH